MLANCFGFALLNTFFFSFGSNPITLLVMHIQPVGRIKKESHANLGMFLNEKVNNQMGTQK